MLCVSTFTNSPLSSAFFGVDRKKVRPHGAAETLTTPVARQSTRKSFPDLPKLSRFTFGIESDLDKMELERRVNNASTRPDPCVVLRFLSCVFRLRDTQRGTVASSHRASLPRRATSIFRHAVQSADKFRAADTLFFLGTMPSKSRVELWKKCFCGSRSRRPCSCFIPR